MLIRKHYSVTLRLPFFLSSSLVSVVAASESPPTGMEGSDLTTCAYICICNTSRMLSIVGEWERANCNKQMLILNDSLTWFGWKIL